MRLRGNSSGQLLVLTSISLIALIGFAAIAVDIGYMYTTRRAMQTAADAAAIAGANALQSTNNANYQQAASDVATLDGFSNGQNGVVVTVGTPTSGPYSGNASYVQVSISRAVPTFFLRVLGLNTLNVAAQAVAGTVPGTGCIYALDPSKSGALSLTGNFTINASCGVIDDSSSSSALSASGIGTVNTAYTGVAGNYSSSGIITFTPTPQTSIAPAMDPLGGVAAPTVGTCTQAASTNSGSYSYSGIASTLNLTPAVYAGGMSISGIVTTMNFATGSYGNGITIGGNVGTANFNPGQYQNGSGTGASISISGNTKAVFAAGSYTFCGPVSITGNNTVTLQPGLYQGGISITGNANVTFSPGTYILAGGGLSVTGNSTLTGTGVTFYDTSATGYSYAPIDLTGNETANLSAPTSGPLEGMLFFQDRSIASGSPGSTVIGNSSSSFDGVVYFPTTALSYFGNSSGSGYTFLIADTITISGNTSMTLGVNYSSLSNGSPIKSSTLFE